jgi:hypothetical protein
MPNSTSPRPPESLGARIVRLASQARVTTPSKTRVSRGEQHEYVRDRMRALAILRERSDARAELARKLGEVSGWVIGFKVLAAEHAPLPRVGVRIGGGSSGWTEAPHSTDRVERPTKRRGRPGRRGKLVAALARSRTP